MLLRFCHIFCTFKLNDTVFEMCAAQLHKGGIGLISECRHERAYVVLVAVQARQKIVAWRPKIVLRGAVDQSHRLRLLRDEAGHDILF